MLQNLKYKDVLQNMMGGTNTLSAVDARRRIAEYKWRADTRTNSWFAIKRGHKMLRDDVDRLQGVSERGISSYDRELTSWMVRNGFMVFEFDEEGYACFYYSGKPYR